MKTKLKLLGLSLMLTLPAMTQIQLTKGKNMPVAGDHFKVIEFSNNNVNEGNSGANVSWDFSSLNLQGIENNYAWKSVNQSLFTDTLNGRADIFLDINDVDGSMFFQTSNDSLQAIALGFPQDTSYVEYTDYLLYAVYPFTFGDSYTDDALLNIGAYSQSTKSTVTADAYGTLKLSTGTFSVLRLVTIDSITESAGGIGGSWSNKIVEISYDWYTQNSKIPLFSIAWDDNSLTKTVMYNNSEMPTSLKNQEVAAIQYYPNPVNDELNFSQTLEQITIYDSNGRLVKTYYNTNNISFSGTEITSGLYFVKVYHDQQQSQFKLIKL